MTVIGRIPSPARVDSAGPQVAEQMRRLSDAQQQGKVNWCGNFSLAAAANTTTVQDDRLTENSEISLHPMDANAASILDRLWFKTLTPGVPWGTKVGQFIVEHPIVTGTYQFRYSIKG